MNQLIKFSATAVFWLALLPVHAAPAQITLKGRVLPAICSLELTAAGVIDYRTIPAARLNPTAFTALEHQQIAFGIRCQGDTLLSIQASDNQRGTVVPGVAGDDFEPTMLYGLGNVEGIDIGGYTIGLIDVWLNDGLNAPARMLFSDARQATWLHAPGIAQLGTDRALSWTALTTDIPGPYRAIAGIIDVRAHINQRSKMPIGLDIPLAGSSTLELFYL